MIEVNYDAQITPQFKLWTEDQCYRVHQATLEVLARTGVRVLEKEALKLLKEAGCIIREDLVRIPPDLVRWAIESAPERIVLAAADGQRKVFLQENSISFGLGNDLAFFHDSPDDRIRKSTIQDVERVSIVADSLDNIDFIASLALASDVTAELTDLYQFRALRTYSSKPILASATEVDVLKALYEMSLITSGSPENFSRNPDFAFYAEPISPLIHSRRALEKLLFCADKGIPVTYASGVMAGATGPTTLAGSLVQGNAECLSGLVIHQLKQKGAPFILGIAGGPMDMKTTNCVYGGPEVPLINAAVGELGRYYRLPSYGMSGCSDACQLDLQAGLEAAFSITSAAWSGANLIHDNGYLGSGMIGSLEYLVLTDEIIDMVRHFMRGIETSDDKLSLEVIDQVGPGGHYLTHEHTIKYFKEETWYPRFMNRRPFYSWLQEDQPEMKDGLEEEVQNLLAGEPEQKLTSSQLEEMEKIITDEEKRISQLKEQGGV